MFSSLFSTVTFSLLLVSPLGNWPFNSFWYNYNNVFWWFISKWTVDSFWRWYWCMYRIIIYSYIFQTMKKRISNFSFPSLLYFPAFTKRLKNLPILPSGGIWLIWIWWVWLRGSIISAFNNFSPNKCN